MSDVIELKNYKALAIEKIDNELKSVSGMKENVVKNDVATTLKFFCEQDIQFAEVLYKTKRTLKDAIAVALKDCSNGISDIETYRKIVAFYFPNSKVNMLMTIELGDKPNEEYILKEAEVEKKAKPKKETPKSEENPKQESRSEKQEKPKQDKKKKSPAKAEDTNVIQLSLF